MSAAPPADGMVFCYSCGAKLHESAPNCPRCGARQPITESRAPGDAIPRNFTNSVRICLRKYADFTGRAPRSEYWLFTLFVALLTEGNFLLHLFLVPVTGLKRAMLIGLALELTIMLGSLLPQLSVQIRRLHDLDRSGWWWWLSMIPLIGSVVLLIWNCQRGTRGPNRFGPEVGLPDDVLILYRPADIMRR